MGAARRVQGVEPAPYVLRGSGSPQDEAEVALGAVLLPSKLLVASAGAELAERSLDNRERNQQRPIRASPLFPVALFRSLRLFVHSSRLGFRTSDESFR